jgi:hypothetical protein
LVARGTVPADRYAAYLEILNEVESDEETSRRRDWKK